MQMAPKGDCNGPDVGIGPVDRLTCAAEEYATADGTNVPVI